MAGSNPSKCRFTAVIFVTLSEGFGLQINR